MKLLENSNSLHDAIKKIASDSFNKEMDDNEISDIIHRLSISDILALNSAYTRDDKGAIAKLLDLELHEYVMSGPKATSVASTRPKTKPKVPSSTQQTLGQPGTNFNNPTVQPQVQPQLAGQQQQQIQPQANQIQQGQPVQTGGVNLNNPQEIVATVNPDDMLKAVDKLQTKQDLKPKQQSYTDRLKTLAGIKKR